MNNNDKRLEILDQARALLAEVQNLSSAQSEELLKLLNVLIEAIERNAGIDEAAKQARTLAESLIQNRNLVFTLKQQADELDALKKLSLNLTSSLDLQTVLDAVVMEAMRLVKNAFSADIFLYTGAELTFGASMDLAGARTKPYMDPRQDGLTFTVARGGEPIFIED